MREVDAHPARHEHERALFAGVLLVVLVFGLRQLRGGIGDDREQRIDLGRVAVATGGFECVTDLGDGGLQPGLSGGGDEDRLGVTGGKSDAAGGGSGLVDHRGALG